MDSPFGKRNSDFLRQVIPSFDFSYDRTRKRWPFNTGDCLIEMTAWTSLTVILIWNERLLCDFLPLSPLGPDNPGCPSGPGKPGDPFSPVE